MIDRRAPGQRRRRSRRAEELEQVRVVDPERHAELLELRHANPQAYRKELRRLIRAGVIGRGRGFEASPELVALLDQDERAVREALDAWLAGGADFRAIAGLAEAERSGRARPDLLGWLEDAYRKVVDGDNRSVRRVTR